MLRCLSKYWKALLSDGLGVVSLEVLELRRMANRNNRCWDHIHWPGFEWFFFAYFFLHELSGVYFAKCRVGATMRVQQ